MQLEGSKDKNAPDKFYVETKVAIPKSSTDYHHENLDETFKNTRSYTKAEIEKDISKLIEECYQELGKFEPNKDFDLSIEWILPDELFSLDVDCWQCHEDEFCEEYTRIGCASFASVHIRSSRRLRSKRLKKWKEKWDFIMSNSQQINASHYIFASQSNTKSNNELKILDNINTIIGINFPADLRQLENLSYNLIIQTGIPLALWSRCKKCDVNHITDLDRLIKPENSSNVLNLENLPKSIETKRLEAKSNQPLHLGHHLCFLWENPYNYPLTPKYNKMK